MRDIRADYLSENPALRPFYQTGIQQPDWQALIAYRQKFPVGRQLLYNVLQEQYKATPSSIRTQENLLALQSERTFCITTGQQPVLFGGPMYIIYKTLTAIRLSDYLNQHFAPYRFVPVFWIASEDHDYMEVNHTYFEYDAKIVYKGNFQGAVGRHLISTLMQNVNGFDQNPQFAPGVRWAEAFRLWLHNLFDRYGLIILDPDTPLLKAVLSPIIQDEFEYQSAERLINESSDVLRSLDYPVQLLPRPINLFYLTDQSRTRIEKEGRNYRAGNLQLSLEAWQNLWISQPECFSPNAALRGLYQELVLPNLTYIGGWAEICYWLQLKGMFDYHKVHYPLLMPRFSGLLVSYDTAEEVARAGFSLDDLFLSDHALRVKIYNRRFDQNELESFMQKATIYFQELQNWLHAIDPSLGKHAVAQSKRTQNFLESLPTKIRKNLRNRYPEDYFPLIRLKNSIQPEGMLQERYLNLAAFGRTESVTFIEFLMQNFELFNYDTRTIIYR